MVENEQKPAKTDCNAKKHKSPLKHSGDTDSQPTATEGKKATNGLLLRPPVSGIRRIVFWRTVFAESVFWWIRGGALGKICLLGGFLVHLERLAIDNCNLENK